MSKVQFKLTTLDNGVSTIRRIGDDRLRKYIKKETWVRRRVDEENPQMPKKNYIADIKNYAERLSDVHLEKGKFKKLTLGSKKQMDYNSFQYEVKKFVTNFKNKYGKITYISAIEPYEEQINHWHCHLIVVFNDLAPKMDSIWLREHWEHGKVNIRNSRNGEEADDLGYITDPRKVKKAILPDNPKLTKYPRNARFINISSNIPRVERSESKTKIIDQETALKLIEQSDKLGRVNANTHMYNDKLCLDDAYIYDVNCEQLLDIVLEDVEPPIEDTDLGENIF